MYICICNAIRESDLRQAALSCDGDATATYARLGKRPNCGQCLAEAQEIIDAVRSGLLRDIRTITAPTRTCETLASS
jgi:bacterioferritin-associated ferredoxin